MQSEKLKIFNKYKNDLEKGIINKTEFFAK